MKRLLFAVALVVVVAIGSVPRHIAHLPGHLAATLSAQEDPATITVYITPTGEKYHRDGCRYLRRSKIRISLKDAVSRD